MTPIKHDIVELIMTNPHELHVQDLKELLADKYDSKDITHAVLSLHLDDNIVGIGFGFELFIYSGPVPYVGEG